jgi:predicted metalloprotease
MRWKGRRQSSNVQDVRGRRGYGFPAGMGRGHRIPIGRGARGGGIGIGGIILLVALFFVMRACGIDPLVLLEGGTGPGGMISQSKRPADDEASRFISTVLAETEDVWHGIFEAEGGSYQEPVLVLFSDQVQSACGFASAASGPFYCPGDRKIYIDLTFYDELDRQFGASGDFAQAYVLAHEVGHHVQNLIGVLPQFNRARRSMSETDANRMSVRVELQADCLAGIWAHFTEQRGLLEEGDIDEAMNAAEQIGDDTLQRRTQGYIVPESFNHGTSEQRRTWFNRGLETGRLADCDTFNSPV